MTILGDERLNDGTNSELPETGTPAAWVKPAIIDVSIQETETVGPHAFRDGVNVNS